MPRASAESSDTTVPTAIRAARSAGKRYTPVEIAGNATDCKPARRQASAPCDSTPQHFGSPSAAAPHRPDRVDHMLRRQLVAVRDPGRSGRAPAERRALFEQLWPGRAVDRASTPPPPSSDVFAAFTIASTASAVMSATHDLDQRRADLGG